MCRYASEKRGADFRLKMQQKCLAAGAAGELTALLRCPSWIQGEECREEEGGKAGGGEAGDTV